MKERYAIIALLTVGAIALLIYLMRQSLASSTASGSAVPDNSAAAPSYPNANSIPPEAFEVGGSPLTITYNQPNILPTTSVGDPCCESCESAGLLTTVQNIAPGLLKQQTENFAAYQNKTVVPTTTVRPSAPSTTAVLDRDFGTQGSGS